MRAIVNAKCITPEGIIEGGVLFDETIRAVGNITPPKGATLIDAKGAYVAPGFVDMHIHGCGGADVMDASPQALETISQTLLQTGTTSFVATTMTMARAQIVAALESVEQAQNNLSGAKLVGVHLEGPYINPKRAGAQDATHIVPADRALIEAYAALIRVITLAPEVYDNLDFVQWCRERFPHIVLSMGHTDASYDQAQKGFEAGMGHVTHLFNAMPAYHHREPGVVGACFDAKDVSCDIIADAIHTHPHHLRLAHKMKPEKLILITDAMRAGCMRAGCYSLGGQEVCVEAGKATLQDGTLAGSVLQMQEAVANMIQYAHISLEEAVRMASQLPAEKLGLSCGALKVGYDADLVLLSKRYEVLATIVDGTIKYQRRSDDVRIV